MRHSVVPVMPVRLVLKVLCPSLSVCDRFVRTGVHVVPPLLDASRNA